MYCTNCGKEIGEDFKVCAYCGKPVNQTIQKQNANTQSNVTNQQYANNVYSTSNQNMNLKPDDKYNLVAGLFTPWWALIKGMWDLALVSFGFMIIGLIPGIGQVINLAWFAVRLIIVGRTANYYVRLKKTQNIAMYQALMDDKLRRI